MGGTAIITGAPYGICPAIAEQLAKGGFTVLANFTSNEVEASASTDNIKAAGRHAIPVKADINKPNDVLRVFVLAENALGDVDVLVKLAPRSTAGKLSLFVWLSPSQSCSSGRVDISSTACFSPVEPRNGPVWMHVDMQPLSTDLDIVRANEAELAEIKYTAARNCSVLLAGF